MLSRSPWGRSVHNLEPSACISLFSMQFSALRFSALQTLDTALSEFLILCLQLRRPLGSMSPGSKRWHCSNHVICFLSLRNHSPALPGFQSQNDCFTYFTSFFSSFKWERTSSPCYSNCTALFNIYIVLKCFGSQSGIRMGIRRVRGAQSS